MGQIHYSGENPIIILVNKLFRVAYPTWDNYWKRSQNSVGIYTLSQLIGVNIMRSLLHTEALSAIPDEQLIKIVGSVCEHYLSDNLGEANSSKEEPIER